MIIAIFFLALLMTWFAVQMFCTIMLMQFKNYKIPQWRANTSFILDILACISWAIYYGLTH
jgi:hypothetical protein